MKTGKYIATSPVWSVRSPNWKGLSAKLRLALILMTALFAVSCRSKQEAVRTIARSDSTVSVKTSLIRQTTPIPSFKTKFDIPLIAVTNLPDKAVYMATDRGLTLTVGRKDTTLVVEARTDSIAPQLTEEFTDTHTYSLNRSDDESKPSHKFPWYLYVIAATLLILLVRLARK